MFLIISFISIIMIYFLPYACGKVAFYFTMSLVESMNEIQHMLICIWYCSMGSFPPSSFPAFSLVSLLLWIKGLWLSYNPCYILDPLSRGKKTTITTKWKHLEFLIGLKTDINKTSLIRYIWPQIQLHVGFNFPSILL